MMADPGLPSWGNARGYVSFISVFIWALTHLLICVLARALIYARFFYVFTDVSIHVSIYHSFFSFLRGLFRGK